MKQVAHSVTLDKDKCRGCTNCVKRCPTEAIRVRNGKAIIIKERCIDCGECIRVCPYHAKKAVVDSFDILKQYEYTIALPAPTLYAQFSGLRNRNVVLTALKRIGFDDVFEVSAAAEAISRATMMDLHYGKLPEPVISSACPTIVRIIKTRFPSLLPNLLYYRSPMELAARWSKRLAMEKTGLPREKIGCIFISPCPAKATSVKQPLGEKESWVDGAISISEIYPILAPMLKDITEPEILARSGAVGVGWARSGGEAAGAQAIWHLSADGIENVINVLEAIEDEKLHKSRFVELNACIGGCVGGALTIENPFIAKSRLSHIMNTITPSIPARNLPVDDMKLDEEIAYEPSMQLDQDVQAAMMKLAKIKELEKKLNGMDCGACGAPTCRALAEDVVSGFGREDQCIFLMREKMEDLIQNQREECEACKDVCEKDGCSKKRGCTGRGEKEEA